ncbi:hypothetical protein F3Y22_tig00117034pilonHSYRG00164 [Hibiscus syriacus]|uniref:Uncharacterized protein n=1 Tax=Hibiscus syriacus TaxID=106335 RepID=A0A6A2WA52_HIBSY|nr:hypothetical protein F3Y22_tig00117034pilonHSYRG00164 [Hibiscus syriacus]
MKKFGKSREFGKSATHALKEEKGIQTELSASLEAALQVADCDYEFGLSDTVFEVTEKDDQGSDDEDDIQSTVKRSLLSTSRDFCAGHDPFAGAPRSTAHFFPKVDITSS